MCYYKTVLQLSACCSPSVCFPCVFWHCLSRAQREQRESVACLKGCLWVTVQFWMAPSSHLVLLNSPLLSQEDPALSPAPCAFGHGAWFWNPSLITRCWNCCCCHFIVADGKVDSVLEFYYHLRAKTNLFLWACKNPLRLYVLCGSQGVFLFIISIKGHNIK